MKDARKTRNLSIDEIANETKIPIKYLNWLENGNYDKLPAQVYIRGFIAKYAGFLNLDANELIILYLKESEASGNISKKNVIPKLKYPKLVITPKFLTLAVAAAVFLGIFGYFGWQIYQLTSPPDIILENPSGDGMVRIENQPVRGIVSKADTLMINGKIVTFDGRGYFSEDLNLSEGLNVIELKAKNIFGKETTIVRKIIYNK